MTFQFTVGMAVVAGLATSSWAEEKVIQEADRVVVRQRTVVDFTDMAVEGELSKPEGTYALSRKKTQFKSLIRVRDNFAPELQKSVDHL